MVTVNVYSAFLQKHQPNALHVLLAGEEKSFEVTIKSGTETIVFDIIRKWDGRHGQMYIRLL